MRSDARTVETNDGSVVAGRIGRFLGTALSAIWLFILVAHLVGGDDEATIETEEATIQGVVLATLAIAAIGGFLLSLRRRRLGGILTVVTGCLLCVFAAVTAGRNHWLAILVSGVPWIVVGSLTLLAGRRRPAVATQRQVGDGPDAV